MAAQSKPRYESRRAFAVSIALHVLVGAAIVRALLVPGPVRTWLHLDRGKATTVEHLRYIALPPAIPQPTAGRPAPVEVPPAASVAPPRLVAPAAVPQAVPPVAPEVPHVEPEVNGTGPVAATGGPAQGARPEYHGPQIWVPAVPPERSSRTLTSAERTDSAVRSIIGHHNDSLAMLGPHREPGDWTVEHNGKKYGIDKQYIHLGPISIPTAILAALPLNNFTGNPIASANERLLTSRHDDIAFQANRALNEEEMNKAIKQERQRKEREHEEQQKHQQDQQNSSPTVAKSSGIQ
jgi:hypothetical protein